MALKIYYWTDAYGRRWRCCSCLKEWLTAYQAEALRRGYIKKGLDLFQAIGNAPKSAGFHANGGNVDMKQQSPDMLRLARNMGGGAHPRDRRDGMTPHAHIGLKGCTHMGSGPRNQITALERGRNGLVNNKADRGPRSGIQWPLRTYKQGIAWANGNDETPEDDMPTPEEFWKADVVVAPAGSEKTWEVQSILHLLARESLKQTKLLEQLMEAQKK